NPSAKYIGASNHHLQQLPVVMNNMNRQTMSLPDAQNWFSEHRRGNETLEETYSRLTNCPNSLVFHNSNDAAIAVIRRHRSETSHGHGGHQSSSSERTSQTVVPSVSEFLQQFRYTKPPVIQPSTEKRGGDMSSPEEKRLRGKAISSVNPDPESRKELKKREDRERKRRQRAAETSAQRSQRLAAVADSMAQHRAAETPAERSLRQTDDAASHQHRRAAETPAERSLRQADDAASHQHRLAAETPAERSQRQADDAASHQHRRAAETPAERSQRQADDAASHQHRRAAETPAERSQRQADDAASHQHRRAAETPAERSQRQADDAASHQHRLAAETPAERSQRQADDAASHQHRRTVETPAERSQRLETVAASMTQHREEVATINAAEIQRMVTLAITDENAVAEHYCGPMNVKCQFCGSHNFLAMRPPDGKFTRCCQKGKLIIPKPVINGVEHGYPQFLRTMMSMPQNPNYRHFREHIRSYNSSVSFASFGAQLANVPGNGPYVFKVQGQTYHLTSHTEPRSEQQRSYAQLYVLDSLTQATNTRMEHPAMAGCSEAILRRIHEFFLDFNSIARSYRLMHEVQQRETELAAARNENVPIVHMVMRTDRQSDERRYNLPTSNEIAMIFVNEDGEPPFNRDIRVYPRNPNNPNDVLFRLNIRNSNLDPMVYALMFPYGQPGWHPDFRCNGKHFSMLQFKRALMAIRDEFSPIMHAGKLTQQWIVDSYLQVEAHNLEYIRHNQNKLRAELYQGLADYVERQATEANVRAGRPIILPSSFQGSPRNMRERLQDAMSIFGKFGPPDLFITFTANPNWREVVENLRTGETVADRSDLVDTVFKIKLDELVRDIKTNGIFGKSVAFVYTIEFQKRGLPHAHILVVLSTECKFRAAVEIDRVVWAEIPDLQTHPRLHGIVSQQMLHGPCGPRCFGDDGNCSKRFPKEYREYTEVSDKGSGYPSYRRRVGAEVLKNGRRFDNRHVVPYSPYLLLKYNAHINVEICTSLRAIKYIYKYVYKGFDCANCKIGHVDGQRVFVHDEISNFINARYCSSPEGFWRLSAFKMHDRSHAVITLPVHLPQQQMIYFEEGHEAEAVAAARDGITKLTAWFTLNQNDVEAHRLLYTEIPYHYTFRNNRWNARVQGHEKVIGRMYGVSPHDEERFCLRLLLLHVPGAISYEYLRTFNGVVFERFKEAAIARNLLASDEEFERFLQEAATFQMPYQLRQSFAYLCVFCKPQNAMLLFEKHVDDLILDFVNLHKCTRNVSINLALHQIQTVLQQHSLECSRVGLPTPTGTYTEAGHYVQAVEQERADRLIPTLTVEQRAAFDKIVEGIDNRASQKLFYLNGPGGSGKTYLYQTLISFIRGRGQTVNAYASTGIASTLLDGATTIHSGFGVPLELDATKTSTIKPTSAIAQGLRRASVLILDEITMLHKHGLRVIDKLLREEIMRNNIAFGGKTVVLSGDFRQTLPIVVRGSRETITKASITSSHLWKNFQNISLTQNMRSAGQNEHNAWLLDLGSGDTPRIPGLSENAVEIPSTMIATREEILEHTFGPDIRNLTVDELSRRVILASTNAVTLDINHRLMEKLDGDFVTYTSADEIVSEGNVPVEGLYPVEFLNAQTPSGSPPHQLRLKVGAVVMLIRNLNKQKGLCNGTRLIVRRLQENFIVCEIISTNHKGDTVFITRLDITPSDSTLPFKMKRRQFPLIPAFAMTINKSQGQSFEIVSVILDEPVFGHGQLYVALSRCRDRRNIKVFIKEGLRQGQLLQDGRWFTENVVYREIFRLTIR
ncbi:uncharacterized protein LOC119083457, partial [Bradysia coprophila]|uniref:uncharacterized protein LOC119083457 n=1 Tax=Bradysia coprophila TaxID=38358 RepID=UPI00187DB853